MDIRRFMMLTLTVIAVFSICMNGCGGEKEGKEPVREEMVAEKTIVETAKGDERFSTLVKALKAADLVDKLREEGPFTVFAPTNDAFDKLPRGTVDKLMDDVSRLKEILLYHVLPGKIAASEVTGMQDAETAMGEPVAVWVSGDRVMINDATVIEPDIHASNGVIHVIDRVIIPPRK